MRMKHQFVVVSVLTLVAALVASTLSQAGMGGGQRPMGQSPQRAPSVGPQAWTPWQGPWRYGWAGQGPFA